MNFSRKLHINRIEKKTQYELLVIGGGIVGAAVLEMASAKGIDSILLEKNLLRITGFPDLFSIFCEGHESLLTFKFNDFCKITFLISKSSLKFSLKSSSIS